MPETRILLAALDPLPRDLIRRRLESHDGLRIVGVCEGVRELKEFAARTRPDFVVLGIGTEELVPDVRELFGENPEAKVLEIETDAGRAFLCQFVGELAPDEIAEVIRRTAIHGERSPMHRDT